MSQLGWVDFSPNQRNKVKTLLTMLNEPGVLDELGIGQIRDAFADLLFPGISTIQTRAKYFIIIPRILREYQALSHSEKQRYKNPEKFLIDLEDDLAKKLVSAHDKNEYGIIGRTKIDSGGVERRPSSVYWNGLKTFEIIKTSLSLPEFIRQLASKDFHSNEYFLNSTEDFDDSNSLKLNKNIFLPDNPEGWKDNLNINLTKKEAVFLKDKFTETPAIQFSIPAQLFKADLAIKTINATFKNNNNNLTQPIDILAETLLTNDKVDEICKQRVRLANEFSLAMLGPHIRYNILLAKNAGFENKKNEYLRQYEEWLATVSSLDTFRIGCELEWFGLVTNVRGIRINDKTKQFISSWCQAIQSNKSENDLDVIVSKQAKNNKGERSLLIKGIEKEQWVGLPRLDYRWSSAKNILKDITVGLNAKT